MRLKIVVSSGKGGTGKTFVSTNIAFVLSMEGENVSYLDCDVEAPNGHLFLKPKIAKEEDITLLSPFKVDMGKCIRCGKCAKACHYNAIAVVKDKVLIFNELCHACGACKVVCPVGAILEKEKKIGTLMHGKSGNMDFHYALLETAEGGMSPRLVRKVKEYVKEGVNIVDSPPGVSCPVVETVKDADLCVLVTDPTPFGINDLKLAVEMARTIGQEPVVLVNRARYYDNNLKDYCRRAELEIIGEIPDDREIAEVYSRGEIAADKIKRYYDLFYKLSQKMVNAAKHKKEPKKIETEVVSHYGEGLDKSGELPFARAAKKPKELVIISGKGGTGKTSLTASFAALAAMDKDTVISDCDVDAADLHLVLKPKIRERGFFSGSIIVEIIQEKCTGCGRCREECRFGAIEEREIDGERKFFIDPVACEGCGTCLLVCKDNAIKTEDAVNGEWFISDTRLGPLSHAKLGVAQENSGRLVTLVRDKEALAAQREGRSKALIDGAPGTGCPVISSITGSEYTLIVTEPTVSGVHDAKRILDVTKHFGIPSGIVVNKYDLNPDITEDIKALSKEYNADFVGVIPYDDNVTKAQLKGISLVEYAECRASRYIKEIWRKLKDIIYLPNPTA